MNKYKRRNQIMGVATVLAAAFPMNALAQDAISFLNEANTQVRSAGSIIYRQRGTRIHPGLNVGIGKDDTLFAKETGIVRFERLGRDKKQVSVYPVETAAEAQ